MATIKAKQTVGNKWLVSMDELPTASGGVFAPLGSEALVNNGGVISMWLKTGPLDTDWTQVQAGTPQDGWNMVYAIVDLDAPTADAYFGSNASAFDGKISFVRKGNLMMEFDNLNQLITYGTNLKENLNSSTSYKERNYSDKSVSVYEQADKIDNITLTNSASNHSFSRKKGNYGANDIVHGILTVVIRGVVDGNTGSAVFKLDYHMMNGVILYQDSFTSQDTNADVAEIRLTDFSYSSPNFTIGLKTKKNAKTMTSTYVKITIEEKVMSF